MDVSCNWESSSWCQNHLFWKFIVRKNSFPFSLFSIMKLGLCSQLWRALSGHVCSFTRFALKCWTQMVGIVKTDAEISPVTDTEALGGHLAASVTSVLCCRTCLLRKWIRSWLKMGSGKKSSRSRARHSTARLKRKMYVPHHCSALCSSFLVVSLCLFLP